LDNRTVATFCLVESVLVVVGLVSAYRVVWHTSYIFKLIPELWRIPTSFLLTGEGISLILEPYFLYRYISDLEVGNARFPKREDLVYYLMFVSVALIVSAALA
jgi:Derlin-2/3